MRSRFDGRISNLPWAQVTEPKEKLEDKSDGRLIGVDTGAEYSVSTSWDLRKTVWYTLAAEYSVPFGPPSQDVTGL